MKFQIAAFTLCLTVATATHAGTTAATPISDLVRDTSATVAGIVERVTDEDEFVLSDATGTVRVYVGPNAVPVAPGEAITVTGMVDDGAALEIYASEIVGADGVRHTFSHSY